MDSIRIEGIPGYDGSYPFDVSYFTNRELHLIKQMTGVRAGELTEAFKAGDTDLIVAMAIIAVKRNGKDIPEDLLWDTPAGGIILDIGETEDDEGNPPIPPPPNDEPSSSGGTNEPSGAASQSGSDLPASGPSLTGTPLSDTGATFAPETSAS